MSKIDGIIPSQNYENVRDQIGAILYLELQNQYVLTSNDLFNCDVYNSKTNPFDKIDTPLINVSFGGVGYGDKWQGGVVGENTFNIDIYTSAKSSDGINGDEQAVKLNHELIGKCRAILENPVYRQLDLAPNTINRTKVESISEIAVDTNDTSNNVVSRLALKATFNESAQLIEGELIESALSQIKLSLTDKGYRYEFV